MAINLFENVINEEALDKLSVEELAQLAKLLIKAGY